MSFRSFCVASVLLLSAPYVDAQVSTPRNEVVLPVPGGNGLPQTNEALADFLWQAFDTPESRAQYLAWRPATFPLNPYSIGDRKLVDLDGGGVVELVATLSTTPRLIYNQLVVVSYRQNAFHFESTLVESFETIADAIRDLDGDGTPEIVVPTAYAVGSSEQNRVIWPIVLHWSSQAGFVDVSDAHRAFYESLLDSALRETSVAERMVAGAGTDVNRELLAGRQMVLDRLFSITQWDVDTPVSRALGWADSPDPVLKMFAIRTFEIFSTPAALERLRALASDENALVRGSARSTLDVLRAKGIQ